jgi:hypothetical protein
MQAFKIITFFFFRELLIYHQNIYLFILFTTQNIHSPSMPLFQKIPSLLFSQTCDTHHSVTFRLLLHYILVSLCRSRILQLPRPALGLGSWGGCLGPTSRGGPIKSPSSQTCFCLVSSPRVQTEYAEGSSLGGARAAGVITDRLHGNELQACSHELLYPHTSSSCLPPARPRRSHLPEYEQICRARYAVIVDKAS